MADRTEPCACPTCGGPSIADVYVYWDGESRRERECGACTPLWWQRSREVHADIDRHAPELTQRTRNCLRRNARTIWGAGGLLAMSDEAFLALAGFGPVALAEVRGFIPRPDPSAPTPPPDPAIFWASRPAILNVVGG